MNRHIILIILLLASQSCSNKVPLESQLYYTRNYPIVSSKIKLDSNVDEAPFIKKIFEYNEEINNTEVIEEEIIEDEDLLATDEELELANENDSNEDISFVEIEEEELKDENNKSNEESIFEDNSLLTIDNISDLPVKTSFKSTDKTTEQRIFSSIITAFKERDSNRFFALSNEYLIAYPNSKYINRIKGLQQEFYFQYTIPLEIISGQTVEINNINFNSWEAFEDRLINLKYYGIQTIIFTPFQNFGENKVPFLKSSSQIGALFKSNSVPMVNDALEKVAEISKKHNIQLYIKIPIKKYDWLDITASSLMDQSYDKNRDNFNYNFKLNLFHPRALGYTKKIIDQISRYEIEGIIFDNDYILEFNEGYSQLNQEIYVSNTGKKVTENDIPNQFWNENFSADNIFSKNFKEYHNWRVRNQHLYLLQLTRYIRNLYPKLSIGVEISEELVNDSIRSIFKYSVSNNQILNLNPDFVVLNQLDSIGSNLNSYRNAYNNLQNLINRNKSIQNIIINLRVEYNEFGIDQFNKSINSIKSIIGNTTDNRIVFGPSIPSRDWLLLSNN